MASNNSHRLYTPSQIHLALLRPAVLQILRSQGYYVSNTSTIDCITELAGQYLYEISKRTAQHATMNNYLGPPPTPDVVDVRLAMEECGVFWAGANPEPPAKRRRLTPEGQAAADDDDEMPQEHEYDEEDTAGVDEFIRWAKGRKNQRIRKIAGVVAPPGPAIVGAEGEDGAVEEKPPTDYLDALKRKHNKTDQDSKWAGTILGRSIDHGEVLIEGGSDTSLAAWRKRMHEASLRPPDPQFTADDENGSPRPPSSGLSSIGDEEIEMLDF
ncbi:hypothetical protein F5Y08DRAFT_294800 [Xylaria arbuscula]|nr:hypothetical protein F5Y08DRAFT_294800 [Xylaria arbuscula]